VERRGVFAQVIGSLELPALHERKRVVGVIINEASRSKLRAIL
jgi:cobyric acid synthase